MYAFVQLKQYENAKADYEKTLALNPGFARARDNFAWLLATADDPDFRDPLQAVSQAKKACELTEFRDWAHLSTLAASYAEAGDFANARDWLLKSHELAPANQKEQLVRLVELYESELEISRAASESLPLDRSRL